jgi:hypothetical protein
LGLITKLKYPSQENYVKYLKKEVRGDVGEKGMVVPQAPLAPRLG